MPWSQLFELIGSFLSFHFSRLLLNRVFTSDYISVVTQFQYPIIQPNNSYLYTSSPVVVINSNFSLTPLGH